MFGIAWSELLLIGIVVLVVVPPKDLPVMMRTVGKWVGQMRRMAFDFQHQVSSALREAEFEDIKKTVSDLTSIDAMTDIRNELESVTRPMTELEGQMRQDLTIAPPEIKSFPVGEPDLRATERLIPSVEADTATPPGHAAWPGAMDLAPSENAAAPENASETGGSNADHHDAGPDLAALQPVPVTVSTLPEHLGGPAYKPPEPRPVTAPEDESVEHQPNLASGVH